MKQFFLLLLFSLPFCCEAQLIDLGKEWFSESGFFNTEEIKKQKVKQIIITKSEKKDGAFFKKEKAFINYYFYDNGLLKESLKFIPQTRRVDTSVFTFYYNNSGLPFKRIEKQGPFLFFYYLVYKNKDLLKEIKIDGNSSKSDTAYIRYYKNERKGNSLQTTVLNSIKRPFKTITKKTDLFNHIIYSKIEFFRSANFSETVYSYQLNQLNSKEHRSYFGYNKSVKWKYDYKNGIVDFVRVTENDEEIIRYGFTYDGENRVAAIVERNVKEKSISVYKFSYRY